MNLFLPKLRLLKLCHMVEYGYSYSEIISALSVGNHTVQRFKKLMDELDIHECDLQALSQEDLWEIFYPNQKNKDRSELIPLFEECYERINARKNPTSLYTCWRDYKNSQPDGLMYSQFNILFNRWLFKNKGMKNLKLVLTRPPGLYIYVDWAGDTADLVFDHGTPVTAHFFVTTLGLSSRIFVMAFPNERTQAVIQGMNKAFQYYSALPHRIMTDNMKTAVTRHGKYEVELSQAFMDLEDFYDTPVIPARPLSPSDKGSVEAAVHYVEQNLISRLVGRKFNTFEELNQAVFEMTEELNMDTREGRRTKSRNQLFEEFDLPAMRPLPSGEMEMYEYKRLKVPATYHVPIHGHYYSVPYRFCGTFVTAKIGTDTILICSEDNQLICSHRISYDAVNLYTTCPEHMPVGHRHVRESLDLNSESLKEWALKIGPDMHCFIDQFLQNVRFEPQAYKSCQAVLHSCDGLEASIGNQAAAACIHRNIYTVKGFRAQLEEEKKKMPENGIHINIRGEGYYS